MVTSKHHLPLFRRPGSVVFIDDESDFLEMIELVMPADWQIRLFTSPSECLAHFREATEQTTADLQAQQRIVDQWHQGAALVPQLFQYWAHECCRFDLPDVLVVDYAMPAMNGLGLLEQLPDWSGACVLLSGQADEHIALEAFNRGLLDQFILKQTPNIARRVHETVAKLLDHPNSTRDQIWRATLTPAQQTLLRAPAVSEFISGYARQHWVEHVVIGDPFGVIGLNASGQPSWLQLETRSTLASLVEVVHLATGSAAVQSDAEKISAGTHLTDIELQQSIGNVQGACVQPAFQIGVHGLLGAHFPLQELPSTLAQPIGYRTWSQGGQSNQHQAPKTSTHL